MPDGGACEAGSLPASAASGGDSENAAPAGHRRGRATGGRRPRAPQRGARPRSSAAPSPREGPPLRPTSGPGPGSPAGGVPPPCNPRRGTGFLPAGQLPRRLQTLHHVDLLRLRSPIPATPASTVGAWLQKRGTQERVGAGFSRGRSERPLQSPQFQNNHCPLVGGWGGRGPQVSREFPDQVSPKNRAGFSFGEWGSFWTSLQPTKQAGRTAPPELSATSAPRAPQ